VKSSQVIMCRPTSWIRLCRFTPAQQNEDQQYHHHQQAWSPIRLRQVYKYLTDQRGHVGGGATYAEISGGASTALGTAIGGTAYNVHTFTSDADLVVTTAGLAEVLLIGGGGGAGYAENASAGGAGGGGVLDMTSVLTIYLAAGTVAIDVGAGGAGGATTPAFGTNGSESAIGSFLSVSGGGFSSGNGKNGGNGASGGGNRNSNDGTLKGKTVQASVGNDAGNAGTNNNSAGGGGGANGAGGNAVGATNTGGAGGNGIDISGFIGGSTYYAGAGGGGGGSGGGGAAGNGGVAGKSSGAGNNAVNYGAGGGGSHSNNTGGNGAAGAVFVRVEV
jgi:hypothetical protein